MNNRINSNIKKADLGFEVSKIYNFKQCTTVFYTLGYICAMELPYGEDGKYTRMNDVKRNRVRNAVNGVQSLPDLYWNTSNPMLVLLSYRNEIKRKRFHLLERRTWPKSGGYT